MPTPRIPARIKRLEGHRAHKPIPDELTTYGTPHSFSHLTKLQKRAWNIIVSSLPDGVLTHCDSNTIERMAIAWAAFKTVSERMNKQEFIVRGNMGKAYVRNPLMILQRQLSEEMRACSNELGL